jgi:hypothetical protein
MDRNSLVVNVLGFWLMLVVILLVGMMFRVWAVRSKYRDGYISFIRYRAYRHILGRNVVDLFVLSIVIAVVIGGIIWMFNPSLR